MTANKTQPTKTSVVKYLDAVLPAQRREEAYRLDKVFCEATGFNPKIWGKDLIGYGRYHYRYESGREGDFLATGFSPRKAKLSIYVLPGYTNFDHILCDLGKHKLGKSCLYINKLNDVDLSVLAQLIRAGLKDLNQRWTVMAE